MQIWLRGLHGNVRHGEQGTDELFELEVARLVRPLGALKHHLEFPVQVGVALRGERAGDQIELPRVADRAGN